MVPKKSEQADLENKKVTFSVIGLVIACSVVLFAFEWKTYDKIEISELTTATEVVEEEIVPITRQELTPPPPPPQPQSTEIEIVEDTKEVEDFKINSEDDQKTAVEEHTPVVVEVKQEEEKVEELEIFTIVEEMPSFPGGDEARIKFIAENIKYPQMAKESGIQGTVYVNFVVEGDGRISNVKVLRGIGGGCDEEAVRVVKMMPRWNPGKQRGKPVRVSFNMPIRFTLN